MTIDQMEREAGRRMEREAGRRIAEIAKLRARNAKLLALLKKWNDADTEFAAFTKLRRRSRAAIAKATGAVP